MDRRVAVFFLIACLLVANPATGAPSAAREKLQRRVNSQIRNLTSGMLARNDRLLSRIDGIGKRLLNERDAGEAEREYRYFVLHHPTPAVFSVAPGDIYLTTGVLDMLDDEDELAVVLAREFYSLQEEHAAARIHESGSGRATGAMLLSLALDVGLMILYAANTETPEPSIYTTSPAASGPWLSLIPLVAMIPSMVVQVSHTNELQESHMAPRLRFGRHLQSDLMHEGAFDELVMKLVHFGVPAEQELSADRAAFYLATSAGYRRDALCSFLQKCSMIQTVEATRLLTAEPGIEKRILEAQHEAETPEDRP